MKNVYGVRIRSVEGGDPIHVSIHGSIKSEVVISVHGFQSSDQHPTAKLTTKLLLTRGFCVISYTVPGRYAADIKIQTQYLEQVIQYVFRINPKARITLIGASLGALVCAIVASRHSTLHALITVNGYFGSYYVRRDALRAYIFLKLKSIWNSDIRNYLWTYIKDNLVPERIRIPTCVIHAKYDRIALPVQSVRFYNLLTASKKLLLYSSKTADHELTNRHDVEYLVREVSAFILSLQ